MQYGRSKAVVPVLVLLIVALWFILRGDFFYVLPWVILFFCCCFFSPFSIAITSLREEIANLSAFRTFVRFVLVWFRLFPLSLEGRVTVCDCGTPWTFLLPFLNYKTLFMAFSKVPAKFYISRIMAKPVFGWAGAQHFLSDFICVQRRLRSAQSDQNLRMTLCA